jgi:hypothetical protein
MRRRALLVLLVTVIVAFRVAPAAPAPPNAGSGHLVGQFDAAGVYGEDDPAALAYDAQGRLVVGGSTDDGSSDPVVGVARHELPVGTLDLAYAVNGRDVFPAGAGGSLSLYAGALDASGRLVLVGSRANDMVVVRVTAAGALDASFDGDGVRTIDFGGGTRDTARAVAFDGTDIVVAGDRQVITAAPYDRDVAVARLDDTGALVGAFGGGGLVDVPLADHQVAHAAVIDDGDVIVAGAYDNDQWFVARIGADGTLDSAFDGDGMRTFTGADWGASAAARDLLVVDGDVVVAGRAYIDRGGGQFDDDVVLARLDAATGAFVTTFDGPEGDGDGLFHVNAGTITTQRSSDEARALVLDGGSLVVGGSSTYFGATSGFVAKFDAATGDTVDTFTFPLSGPGMVSHSDLGAVRDLAVTASGYAALQERSGSYQLSLLDAATGAFVTTFGRPRAPLNVTAVAGDAQATVSWDPPPNTGGGTITGYTIVVKPGNTEVNVGTDASAVVTGLTNGVEYQFAVKATNAAGTSGESSPSSGVTPTAPPPTTTTTTTTTVPPPPKPAPKPAQGVIAPGGPVTVRRGKMVPIAHATPPGVRIVAAAETASRRGSWTVSPAGAVYTYGDARFYGSMGHVRLNKPVNGMTVTPTGKGYWLVASDGGIFSFGDARFYGSTGSIRLNKPIVGMAATPSNRGYWLVASDGGIFCFGDARFYGSMGHGRLNKPVNGMASTPTGKGYWMVASDGGIFSFGDARFYGSTGGLAVGSDIVGMISSATGKGYTLITADGRLYRFGDA